MDHSGGMCDVTVQHLELSQHKTAMRYTVTESRLLQTRRLRVQVVSGLVVSFCNPGAGWGGDTPQFRSNSRTIN
eukprot:3039971-Rhodomonas_salina.2